MGSWWQPQRAQTALFRPAPLPLVLEDIDRLFGTTEPAKPPQEPLSVSPAAAPGELVEAFVRRPRDQEAAEINPARPVVRVTRAERDQFRRDKASILARYPGYVAGAEADPVFIITDEPLSGRIETPITAESQPTILQSPPASPPATVASATQTSGTDQSDIGSDRSGGSTMGVVTDFFRGLGGSLDFDPSTPGIFDQADGGGFTSLPDIIGGLAGQYLTRGTQLTPTPFNTMGPTVPYEYGGPAPVSNVVPIRGSTMQCPPTLGCISKRDVEIAQCVGASPELVDMVLKLGRRNRRRKRMATKSDIGDIAAMKAVLGNGEAFKVWLAKATR